MARRSRRLFSAVCGVLLISFGGCGSTHTSPLRRVSPDHVIDLDLTGPQRGWALIGTLCQHERADCPAVYRTRDGGKSWSRSASPGAYVSCLSITKPCINALSFVTPEIGYLYGPAMFMTTNGGRVWKRVPGPAVESLASSGSEVFRVVYRHSGCPGPCDATLQRSKPGRRSWTTLRRWGPLGSVGEQVLAANANLYVIRYGHIAGGVTSHATIEVSHDRGRSWTASTDPCGGSGGQENDTSAAAAAGNSLGILCVSKGPGPSFTVLSRNAGRTFTAGAPLHPNIGTQIAIDGATVAVADGGFFDGGGSFDYRLALSRDGGRTWRIAIRDHEPVPKHLAGPLQIQLANVDSPNHLLGSSLQFANPRDLSWVGYPYFIWHSFDRGRTWHRTPAP